MNRENFTGNLGGVELDVGLEFHKIIDFDKKALRRSLRDGAREVIKESRRLVARRAISAAGEFPGVDSGTLKRAIGIVGRGSRGGWIRVGVRKTDAMKAFYPAFLFYGSVKTGLAKRANYIVAALDTKRQIIRSNIRATLMTALVPR